MSGEEDKKVDLKLSEDPSFQELQKTVKGLGMIVTQQQQQGVKLQESISSLVGKLDGLVDNPRGNDLDDDDEDAINDLDNKKLVKLVLSEVGKVIDEKIGAVGKRIDSTASKMSEAEVKRQIVDLGAKDFFDWSDEIGNLAKANPNLSVKQLYKLARDENPEKATQLDEKYKDKSEDKGKQYLSLMPTSGATAESDEKLTSEQALEKAWEETIEEFPGLANLGEG